MARARSAPPVPLALMARRLAPFIVAGLIDHDEAMDTIMPYAIARTAHLDWTKLNTFEAWLDRVLAREVGANRNRQHKSQRKAA